MECRDLQEKKRYDLCFKELTYENAVRENMRQVLKVLSPAQMKDLQSELFDDVKKWLSMSAKTWSNSMNCSDQASKSGSSLKNKDYRKMCMPPNDLLQWANDAFHYADPKIVELSSTERDEESQSNDFTFLVSLANLIVKMVDCARSTVDGNVMAACRQYKVCESYATSGSRWIFTLVDFPFSSILEAGSAIDRKSHQAATAQHEAQLFEDRVAKISNIDLLGKAISTFITVSRDEEMSSGNRDTWCRAFREGIKRVNWSHFTGESGTPRIFISFSIIYEHLPLGDPLFPLLCSDFEEYYPLNVIVSDPI